MAHECILCGSDCFCGGDIDDVHVMKNDNCKGCGCEDDFNGEDDGEPDEYDYYYCYGCFFSTNKDYGGWGCPRCGAIMSGEYF